MEELNYLDATIHDLPEIVAIYNSTIPGRLATADTDPVTIESKLSWFNEHTPHKRPLLLVKTNEDKTIGWVSFQSFYGRPAYDATAEISIYLNEDNRGKGLGRRILEHAIAECDRLSVKTLLGFIFLHNEKSLKLFYNAGFRNWGTLPDVAILDGIKRSLVIMGKQIDPRCCTDSH